MAIAFGRRLLGQRGGRSTETLRAYPDPDAKYEDSDEMATGTVKWFNADKGYGFIAPDEGGDDVFVHITAVHEAGLKGLEENQKVQYELQAGRDGRSSAGALQVV